MLTSVICTINMQIQILLYDESLDEVFQFQQIFRVNIECMMVSDYVHTASKWSASTNHWYDARKSPLSTTVILRSYSAPSPALIPMTPIYDLLIDFLQYVMHSHTHNSIPKSCFHSFIVLLASLISITPFFYYITYIQIVLYQSLPSVFRPWMPSPQLFGSSLSTLSGFHTPTSVNR